MRVLTRRRRCFAEFSDAESSGDSRGGNTFQDSPSSRVALGVSAAVAPESAQASAQTSPSAEASLFRREEAALFPSAAAEFGVSDTIWPGVSAVDFVWFDFAGDSAGPTLPCLVEAVGAAGEGISSPSGGSTTDTRSVRAFFFGDPSHSPPLRAPRNSSVVATASSATACCKRSPICKGVRPPPADCSLLPRAQ